MSAPTSHTTPAGSIFRISLIQAIREQTLFLGQNYTFHVEKESSGEVEGAVAFEVKVRYAPIALAMVSPEDRLRTEDYAENLVKRTLDAGTLQDTQIEVTSDGAVKLGDDVIDRVFAIS